MQGSLPPPPRDLPEERNAFVSESCQLLALIALEINVREEITCK